MTIATVAINPNYSASLIGYAAQDKYVVLVDGKSITTHPTAKGAAMMAERFNTTGTLEAARGI